MGNSIRLSALDIWTYNEHRDSPAKDLALDQRNLDQFLKGVEKRAYRMAYIATQQQADALDIVQDTMIRLARSYANKPSEQWPALFFRILHNRILDWHRQRKRERSWLNWFSHDNDDERETSVDPDFADHSTEPSAQHQGQRAIQSLDKALHELPPRQQQAFLLRSWEGLSVAETAKIMGCSQGSVKTHFSRATQSLREKLEGQWP